jgi:hypothetical protein
MDWNTDAPKREIAPAPVILQWSLTLAAGVVFLGGYFLAWSRTPSAMAGIYLAMAAVCAVETFGYLEGNLRFVAMGLEYARTSESGCSSFGPSCSLWDEGGRAASR